MISKNIFFPILALSVLATNVVQANKKSANPIKIAAVATSGLAAGALVAHYLPGPLPAKVIAGAATTVLVTPGLLLYQNLHRINKSLEKYIGISHFSLSLLAAPVLGITAGTAIAQSLQTSTPTQVVSGTALATGITAAALGLWTLITLPGAMAGGTGKG